MRKAETIYRILRDHGAKRLPVERLNRQLFNLELNLQAYGKIYRNSGAMTQGVTSETVDGKSMDKILSSINFGWSNSVDTGSPKVHTQGKPQIQTTGNT